MKVVLDQFGARTNSTCLKLLSEFVHNSSGEQTSLKSEPRLFGEQNLRGGEQTVARK